MTHSAAGFRAYNMRLFLLKLALFNLLACRIGILAALKEAVYKKFPNQQMAAPWIKELLIGEVETPVECAFKCATQPMKDPCKGFSVASASGGRLSCKLLIGANLRIFFFKKGTKQYYLINSVYEGKECQLANVQIKGLFSGSIKGTTLGKCMRLCELSGLGCVAAFYQTNDGLCSTYETITDLTLFSEYERKNSPAVLLVKDCTGVNFDGVMKK